MLPNFLQSPGWWGVILATVALTPLIVALAKWLKHRWNTRHLPTNTQAHKDRRNYERLLRDYEGNLTLLEDLIVIRSQVEASKTTSWTSELQSKAVHTRDKIYRNLERRSENERHMGIFQKMDALEGRMVGIAEERRKRIDLETRQAEIESHHLFIGRSDTGSE